MYEINVDNYADIPFINKDIDRFVFDSLTMDNPAYIENEARGRKNYGVPKTLEFFESDNDSRLRIPRGFIDEFEQYCNDHNLKIEIRRLVRKYNSTCDFKYLEKLRRFQKIAINKCKDHHESIVTMPPGAGKTHVGMAFAEMRQLPTMIIVPTKALIKQWIKRIEKSLGIPAKDIGVFGAGQKRLTDINLGLVKTLQNNINVLDHIGNLILDEVHRLPANTMYDVVRFFKGEYIQGLSATPYRLDGLTNVIKWFSGPIRYDIDLASLIKQGYLAKPEFFVRETNFGARYGIPYYTMMEWMIKNVKRNELIIDDVCHQADKGEMCIVLSDQVEHLEILSDMQSKRGFKNFVLHGKVPEKKQDYIIEAIENKERLILNATTKLIGEGFDSNNLSSLFLAMPVKFVGRLVQYVGRVLRIKDDDSGASIFDYHDRNMKTFWPACDQRIGFYNSLTDCI